MSATTGIVSQEQKPQGHIHVTEIFLYHNFVKVLDARYAEKARAHKKYVDNSININAKVLNDDEMLNILNEYLREHEVDDHCLLQDHIPYENAIENIAKIDANGSKLLSPFPKYVNSEGMLIKPSF